MKEIILIKYGEIALKGLNRSSFEAALLKTIKSRLLSLGDFSYTKSQSTLVIEPQSENIDLNKAEELISKVFGIAAYARAAALSKDMDDILDKTPLYLKEKLESAKTFKVEAKRSDKKFPLTSPQISKILGGKIASKYPHLSVDVHNPDITITIEVRDKYAFARADQLKGAGGLPTGTAGKAALLVSGGIDSPVAGYMMAKRAIELISIHFASPPYTSKRAEQKVHSLLMKVAEFCGKIKLYVVPFTKVQEEIQKNCPENYYTLIMRRFMMKISETIAKENRCEALITGESVGQVASQTLSALAVTDAIVSMPVFRPLIGLDKTEIIKISRDIETFDISVLPFEDCCTVFTPKHPKTRPHLSEVENIEKNLNYDLLCENAIKNAKIIYVDHNGISEKSNER
ncbi:MAG TPA: tRNA uracil 4-sulfurtransferase ThiI [Oscillospiraceae bacterium]|nr:tRNA uracil 4-sulfurtransferase ThiI [Oscillospiraceae bacterium]